MIDPRTQPGFQPHLFPRCDHDMLPPLGRPGERDWLIKLEFLAAYYELNVCAAQLQRLRGSAAEAVLPAAGAEAEGALEAAICAKESLDARYASRGIAATAEWNGSFFEDVTFSFPPRDGAVLHVQFRIPPP